MNKAPRCVQDTDATGLGVWLQKYKIISKNWNTLLYLHKKSSCYVVLTLVNIQAYTNKSARPVAFLKAYIRINFACWGILLQSCVCSWCGFMIHTSSNQRHSGTKALFSVPAQIHFLAYPDRFFKMWSAKKPPNTFNAIFALVWKCNSNQISTKVLQSGRSGHSNGISKCLLCHSTVSTTQWRHQIQSDGSASEWLSRFYAATSDMEDRGQESVDRHWNELSAPQARWKSTISHALCIEKTCHHWCCYWCQRCYHSRKVGIKSGYTNPIWSLANNSAQSQCQISDLKFLCVWI